MVHPDQKQVLPLFPEAITHQDGDSKNDCELKREQTLDQTAFGKRFQVGRFGWFEDSLICEWSSR